jgi:glutaconyl-CoA/methylmalonyl-CoA decarboxylase subunit delta
MMTIAEISWDFSLVGTSGWIIFIIGWLVVFFALILLSLVFQFLPDLFKLGSKQSAKIVEKGKKVKEKRKAKDNPAPEKKDVITGELTAAIACALHMYFTQLHDDEARILKVVHKSRKYSPWNSKIYNVMNLKR